MCLLVFWFCNFVGVYFCIHWCACLAYCFLKSFIFIVILAGIFIYINIMYMGHSTRLGQALWNGVSCYVGKYTIYYHLLWFLLNITVTSYSRHRIWFHSNLKKNWECVLIIRIMNGTSTYVTRTPCHKACQPSGMTHMYFMGRGLGRHIFLMTVF